MIEVPGWKSVTHEDGQEVLMKRQKMESLSSSYGYAKKVALILSGTEAEHDFTVLADPVKVIIVLHAYNKGTFPVSYLAFTEAIAKSLSN